MHSAFSCISFMPLNQLTMQNNVKPKKTYNGFTQSAFIKCLFSLFNIWGNQIQHKHNSGCFRCKGIAQQANWLNANNDIQKHTAIEATQAA